jgi:hypothetical protein
MLTALEETLAEAHGLAIAASETVERVAERIADPELLRLLDELRLDAREVRGRCLEAVGEEQLAHANTIAARAADLANAWFKAGTGARQAWAFLAMGEAGEVATWTALCSLAAADERLAGLAAWGLDLQRRHLELVLQSSGRILSA